LGRVFSESEQMLRRQGVTSGQHRKRRLFDKPQGPIVFVETYSREPENLVLRLADFRTF